MFGSKTKESTPSKSMVSTPSINSLVKATKVEGTITSESDIRIDGEVNGHIQCKAKVIIGPSGRVEGEIHCQNAMIEGQFTGKLRVKDHLQIKEQAKVEGDIQTDKLSVQPGAVFNVSCAMNKGVNNFNKEVSSKKPEKELAGVK